MRTSESIINIAKALAAAQGAMKNPDANEEVKVHAKADKGGGLLYTYKYATLPKCFDAVREPFAKNGLSHTAAVMLNEKGGAELVVRIYHESGEFYESSIPLTPGLPAKDRAGEITFWKRYLFNGLVGISGDDDIPDESGERAPQTGGSQQRPAQQSRPQQQPAQKSAQNGQQNRGPQPNSAQNVQKNVTPEAEKKVQEAAKNQPSGAATFSEGPVPRLRGEVVKEIMAAGKALELGQDLTPPDIVSGLEIEVGKLFPGKTSGTLTIDELEKLLAKLQNDQRGK